MEKLYDLIIIGSGPAGLAAAVYAQRAMLDTLVIEKNPMSGGQILNTYEVDNYPGLPTINGFDLGIKMREHANQLGAVFIEKEVDAIKNKDTHVEIAMRDGQVLSSKTIIVATGAHYRHLDIPKEKELTGMGVSYCATCDGAFFRGRTVAVVGGGDVALEDAIFLARGCEKVYVIHRRDEFRGTKVLQQQLLGMDNIEVIWDCVPDEICGDQSVSGIKITNKNTGIQTELPVDGVFIAIGNIPDSQILNGVVDMDKGGYVIADETGVTSEKGIFVAGDLRTKQLRQVVTAASDGANALFSVEKYLVESGR